MENETFISELKKYAAGMNCHSDVFVWIDNHLRAYAKKNNIEISEAEHVIDYLASEERPKRLSKMSYSQAKNNSDKWNKSLVKKGRSIIENEGDTEIVKDFGDGFKIVKLVGKNAYEREGNLMRNCVASYFGRDKEIYSLRDKNNEPHATLEKDNQIKGKGNGYITAKYIKYIVEFLQFTGMNVRDSEMENLGYFKIEDDLRQMIQKQFKNASFYNYKEKNYIFLSKQISKTNK
jgi:hypothetical protein